MLKRLGVVIPSTILTLLMAVGFSTPVFAYVDTTAVAEEPVQVVEEAEPTEEEKIPFTIKPHDFMQGIHGLLDKMLADLRQIPTVAAAPHHNKVSVGSCPVCGNPVHESKLSFCCADRSCKFALWKESRYLSNMRKTLDKKMAVDLLKKGRTHVKDFYSAKKDKTFAADLVMRVEEGRAQYSLEFPKAPMKKKT